MKRMIWLALAMTGALLTGGCGPEACNNAGDRKYVGGDGVYVCADRRTGSGLRWYKETEAISTQKGRANASSNRIR
jgi:hypothetical protein